MVATMTVERSSQPVYRLGVETIADRIRTILAHYGWSQRELARRASIAETHVGLMLRKFASDPNANVEKKTLRALAQAAGVSSAWLEEGEGSPAWGESVDPPAPPEDPQRSPDVPLHDQAPTTMAHLPGYGSLERAARKLAPDLDEWVWQYLRTSNPLLDSRYPITPASLETLARAISKHATPPANTTR